MGHEGLWYEQRDMWSKYLRRPRESLGEMCFAQFAKMYTSGSSSRAKLEDDSSGHEEAKGDDEDMDNSDDGYNTDTELNDDKFNYVMTHNNNKKLQKRNAIT